MKIARNLPVVLVVDDEQGVLEAFKAILSDKFKVLTADSGKEALNKVKEESVSLVFLDIKMSDMTGIQVLSKIKEYDKDILVIMATAVNDIKTVVKAIQLGAFNYVTKPFDAEEIMVVARKAIEHKKLRKEIIYSRFQQEKAGIGSIIGKSRKMKDVYKMIERVSGNDATTLITGESGTGKELAAHAIHYSSSRQNKPFIALNCASIPENLLESELFGYEKGAFTDAAAQKLGILELADEGTLFLDEISDLRLDMQAKLLRVLEEKEIKRVGGIKIIKIDVRIISATNIDLRQAVREGKFRQDLYYRLNIIPIRLPALRERKEDIPLLAEHFLRKYNQALKKEIDGFSGEALRYLMNYNWPGNVRELKNIIERLAVLKDEGIINPKDLLFDTLVKSDLKGFLAEGTLKQACNDFERQYIKAVLEEVSGNQSEASKALGIHRNALFNKMKKLGLKNR